MKIEFTVGSYFFSVKPIAECSVTRRLGQAGVLIGNYSIYIGKIWRD